VLTMRTSVVRNPITPEQTHPADLQPFGPGRKPVRPIETQAVQPLHPRPQSLPQPLRMYTEDEVSEMLQISLSQLRKWRMKHSRNKSQGPPFKKIGRLVRYPEQGLLDYVNGTIILV